MCFLAGALLSGSRLAVRQGQYRREARVYESLRAEILAETGAPEGNDGRQGAGDISPCGETEPGAGPDQGAFPLVDAESLKAENPDFMAWIWLPGTDVSYPVVDGRDNEYYLEHLFNGKPGRAGCPFLDGENKSDFSDRHLIIYGHHLRDGSMFSSLTQYRNLFYYKEHPYFWLITAEGPRRVLVFSAYTASEKEDAWRLSFSSDAEFESWLDAIGRRSLIETGVDPETGRQIVTLSTCAYDFQNARFVVHGMIE